MKQIIAYLKVMPGGTDKAIKMAGSTVDKKT
jgi:hypothetical protein